MIASQFPSSRVRTAGIVDMKMEKNRLVTVNVARM